VVTRNRSAEIVVHKAKRHSSRVKREMLILLLTFCRSTAASAPTEDFRLTHYQIRKPFCIFFKLQ
jgi:hypothetical protein